MTHVLRMATIALPLAFLAAPALADATIKVSLWDKGGMMDMSKHMGMGMRMGMGMEMRGNMKMAMMGIDVDSDTVPAGKVTFDVTNMSKDMEHEMLVAPVSSEEVQLPFLAAESRVDEEAAGELGEVEELEPGKSGSLSVDLKPGLYVLFCNIPGHFTAGMWKTIKVQ